MSKVPTSTAGMKEIEKFGTQDGWTDGQTDRHVNRWTEAGQTNRTDYIDPYVTDMELNCKCLLYVFVSLHIKDSSVI